jgi:L-serine deaminase
MNYLFKNGKELLKLCDKHKMPISEVAINLEAESQQDTMEYIKKKLIDV